ncbi:MAG: DinB family protein [Phycisphaerales bacterium]|nr:DinB family protein [Phycisphaerales bacterium]
MFSDLRPQIDLLDGFPAVLWALVVGLTDDALRWRPSENDWAIIEILRHLYDEEREDFRPRLQSTLFNADDSWAPIDPVGWAAERKYLRADLDSTLDGFQRERTLSVGWLRELADVDLNVAHEHPSLGTIRAGDLLAAWIAHDQLHLRQIARRRFQIVERALAPFSTRYAGEWPTPAG